MEDWKELEILKIAVSF